MRLKHQLLIKQQLEIEDRKEVAKGLKCVLIQNASLGCHFQVEAMQKLLVFVLEPPNLYIPKKKILMLNV